MIHLDIDAAEIGKLRHADIPVVGPLKQVLRDLAAELRKLVAEGKATAHRRPGSRRSPTGASEFPLRYRSRATP